MLKNLQTYERDRELLIIIPIINKFLHFRQNTFKTFKNYKTENR